MKVTNDIYDEINTIDELISALIQLRKKHSANTKVVGASIIKMGIDDNGLDVFDTHTNLHISVFPIEFDNTIHLCMDGEM